VYLWLESYTLFLDEVDILLSKVLYFNWWCKSMNSFTMSTYSTCEAVNNGIVALSKLVCK
jgi:hypothetical protein